MPPATDPPPVADPPPPSSERVQLAANTASIMPTPLPQSSLDSFSLGGPTAAPPVTTGSFADVAALVESLPAPIRPAPVPARSAPKGKAPVPDDKAAAQPAPAKPAASRASTAKAAAKPARKAAPAPKDPSRIWVQVAGGANRDALPREFARLKAKAPKIFAGKTAWTTPLHATNRLLVGPFDTDAEARDFVNQLAKADLAGFSWTSPKGQAIEKLPAR
jgi:nucleoid-associated protein YgaU